MKSSIIKIKSTYHPVCSNIYSCGITSEMLHHPSQIRMEQTLHQHYTWPGLHDDVLQHVSKCSTCQHFKKQQKQYGHLPPKKAESTLWTMVCVDLIGPYTVKTCSGEYTLNAMTMIDPTTSWLEIHKVLDKMSETIALTFNWQWLGWYPQPHKVIFDHGSEFIGQEFYELLESYGIKHHPITTKNPQANSMDEHVHQVCHILEVW